MGLDLRQPGCRSKPNIPSPQTRPPRQDTTSKPSSTVASGDRSKGLDLSSRKLGSERTLHSSPSSALTSIIVNIYLVRNRNRAAPSHGTGSSTKVILRQPYSVSGDQLLSAYEVDQTLPISESSCQASSNCKLSKMAGRTNSCHGSKWLSTFRFCDNSELNRFQCILHVLELTGTPEMLALSSLFCRRQGLLHPI